MVSDDERFLFDNQGYLHLRGALTPEEVATYLGLVEENRDRDVRELNEDPTNLAHQINRPLSRMIDADVRFARLLDHREIAPATCEALTHWSSRHVQGSAPAGASVASRVD